MRDVSVPLRTILITDPGIQEGVGYIDGQVDKDIRHGDNHKHRLNDWIVAAYHPIDRAIAAKSGAGVCLSSWT